FFVTTHRPSIATLFPYTTLSDLTVANERNEPKKAEIYLKTAFKNLDKNSPILVQAYVSKAQNLVLKDQLSQANELIDSILPSLRSEEHTSELQSRENLVCRLLLE